MKFVYSKNILEDDAFLMTDESSREDSFILHAGFPDFLN